MKSYSTNIALIKSRKKSTRVEVLTVAIEWVAISNPEKNYLYYHEEVKGIEIKILFWRYFSNI